ncbi:MAG: hypothetical protein KBD15_02130 [Candidatus Magasanikbacteria bacterium]|jgi:hypothetical protein|nr:hypothetical protein [Candidatus Magasanikbacteria bacterium]
MTQKTTITLGSIGLLIILVAGIMYWQNTPESTDKTNAPAVKATSTSTPPQPQITTSTNSTNTTGVWNTHTQFGIRMKYPNDGTYSIETPEATRFIITQKQPGNRIHVTERTVPLVPTGSIRTQIINGYTFQQFEVLDGGYGYMIEKNGKFYTFESVWPRTNDVFEMIMTTVEFESK